MNKVIRVRHTVVEFFKDLLLGGYQMPNGEFRVGLSGTSKVLGYRRDWLAQALKRRDGTVKALVGIGYSGNLTEVTAQSNQGNSFKDRTISLDDFSILIGYAV